MVEFIQMIKKGLVSGTVFQFNVPHSMGLGYCKILDFRHLRKFDGLIAMVYDYINLEPIRDVQDLTQYDLLFGPRRMPGAPKTRGVNAWKAIGVLLGQDDDQVPDFKYSAKSSLLVKQPIEAGPWYVVKSLTETSKNPISYNCLSHLEDTIVSYTDAIEIRTAMEIYRRNGMDCRDFFDLAEPLNFIVYKQMMDVPIYKLIPKAERGRVLNGCT